MISSNVILGSAVVCTALMAGLYFSYSCSVNPGLAKVSDENYIAAMQSINLSIQNTAFFLCFFGTLLLLPISAWQNYGSGRFQLLLFASAFYAIGSFGVTMLGNVPLNEALAMVDLKDPSQLRIHFSRVNFEKKWNVFHFIRTASTIIALILIVWASLKKIPASGIQ